MNLAFLLRLHVVPSCLAQQKSARVTQPCEEIEKTHLMFLCLVYLMCGFFCF